MAQTGINIAPDAFPAIMKLLGIDTGQDTPPPQSDYVSAPPVPAASPIDPGQIPMQSAANGPQGDTKLDLVKQMLGAAAPADAPPTPDNLVTRPPDQVDNAGPIAKRDLSAVPLSSGVPDNVKGPWAAEHPHLAAFLRGALNFVSDAGPGIGAPTFGQGFATAKAQPGIRAQAGLEQQMGQAQLQQTQAKTKEIQSHAEDIPVVVNGQTYFIPRDKSASVLAAMTNSGSREKIATQTDATKKLLGLRKQGMKLDENGQSVPLEYDELSPAEQAHIDLQQAQTDAATARAELSRAELDPKSPKYQLALGRLRTAQQNASTALGRLGLSNKKYLGDYLGLDEKGNPLPSAPIDESGTPMGLKTAGLVKPTNATRSKAEQAGVILQQGNDLINQVNAHPDIYGVAAGRWNEFNAGKFGNASPEVRDAYTSLKSFAALQPALHGARGIGMMKEFEDAVGSMANDPEGLKASIGSIMRTAGSFQKAGTMRTAQPGAASPSNQVHGVYDPATKKIVPAK